MPNSYSLIIPCYNPPTNWSSYFIQRVLTFEKGLGSSIEVILVNDGSSTGIDKTTIDKIAKALTNFQYLELPENKGKGAALRTGVSASTAKYILFTDVDFPYTNKSMLDVATSLKQSNEVTLGYRNTSYYEQTPAFRKFLSRIFRFVLKTILRLKVTDTQCGLKGFGKEAKIHFLQTRVNRFLFDFEFARTVSRDHTLEVKTIPVELRDGVSFTTMTPLVLAKEAFNFLILLLR